MNEDLNPKGYQIGMAKKLDYYPKVFCGYCKCKSLFNVALINHLDGCLHLGSLSLHWSL